MESAFAASDTRTPAGLPPTSAPLPGCGWTAAADGAADAAAAQPPLDWSQHPQNQQHQQQAMQELGPYWGAPIHPAGSLPIPAHWGPGSGGFCSVNSGEPTAGPPFATTWPPPAQVPPMMLPPMQLYWDPQQAAEAHAGPLLWHGSWPGPQQECCQTFMPGAAAYGAAMPTPLCAPCFPGVPCPELPPYRQQGPFPGGFTAQQQPRALPPPAYAISPPAPASATRQGRLVARRKKAALPAEPSFGCDSGNLEGGSSAVLLLSAEASQAPDELAATSAATEAEAQPLGMQRSRAASLVAAAEAASPQGSSGPAAQPMQPSIEFDKAPRAVEWRPYSLAEYRQKRYDAKQAATAYWQLGSLGPAHPDDEQTGKRERQQQFGQAVSKANRERIATQAPRQQAPPPRPGASVRQRALQFAKHSVPKPGNFKSRPAGGSLGRSASGPAAAAAAAVEHVDTTGGMLPEGAPADEGGTTEPAPAGAVELLDGELGELTLAEALPAHGESEHETAAAGGQA